jgi:hypothetical protein
VIAVDAVLGQRDFPFQVRIDDRALDQHAAAALVLHPLEPAAAVGIADEGEVGALRGSGGAGGQQVRIFLGGAVAILAADLDGIGDLHHR